MDQAGSTASTGNVGERAISSEISYESAVSAFERISISVRLNLSASRDTPRLLSGAVRRADFEAPSQNVRATCVAMGFATRYGAKIMMMMIMMMTMIQHTMPHGLPASVHFLERATSARFN